MGKNSLLKQLIDAEETLVMPDAFDPLSARLIEFTGFKAVQCSGYSISISKSYSDENDVSLEENLAVTESIVGAVKIPVMADGEDGFGDGELLRQNIIRFIQTGAAGVNIEDQNLREPGKAAKIIPLDRMLAKLKTAMETKNELSEPGWIINARTDALREPGDRKVVQKLAIERANRYLELGADLCFITNVRTRDEVALFAREVQGPLSIAAGLPYNIDAFSIQDCRELGIARVSLPSFLIFSALQGMHKVLESIKEKDGFAETLDNDLIFSDMKKLKEILQ